MFGNKGESKWVVRVKIGSMHWELFVQKTSVPTEISAVQEQTKED